MLDIETFDARHGGNVAYKALAHPLAAEVVAALYGRLRSPAVLVDPDGLAGALLALHPHPFAARYVQDVAGLGQIRASLPGLPLTELAASGAGSVLVAGFDTARLVARLASLLPEDVPILSLDQARIPPDLLTVPGRYLDRLNFATNHAFFRDADGLSTRLVTANYWAGYGARGGRLWLRLFDRAGAVLATWEQALPDGPAGIVIDSADIRARFGLKEFVGQLFVHAIGIAGHDVVKYALDTYGSGNEASLSVTHDANAWPSDRYAGIPAPAPGERVTLWLQNSHAVPIPAGAVALDRMGAERPVALGRALGSFETVALDVAELLPDLAWPAQIELRCGRHVVRPRYEVTRDGRTRIAHANVERANLSHDPGIPNLPAPMGRGYLLPLPVLPQDRFRTWVLPTPMAETQTNLPLRIEAFAPDGTRVATRFLGCLPRDHATAVDVDALAAGLLPAGGHVELLYDFAEGGQADGWLHALVRAEHRDSGHAAESSFGAHIFNTAMTYRDEPQSYSGPPPGLSTRLFLKLGQGDIRSFALLIYAASAVWRPHSSTILELRGADGASLAEKPLAIACSGSAMVFPDEVFGLAAVEAAGEGGYVLIRDQTCRLFGYHGTMVGARFSLDHMFGF